VSGPLSQLPKRLGLNHGAYRGEQIDIWDLLNAFEFLAPRFGWTKTPLNHPPDAWLPAYTKTHPHAQANIYLSTGIHGDEPAGPKALLRLMEENQWPSRFNYWMVPCLNPDGFERNTRENENLVDLNRDYKDSRSARVKSHKKWLSEQPRFDLAIMLHEDWEANGFYLYEVNPKSRPSVANAVVEAVRPICPIEHSTQVDGRDAEGGMIRFIGHIPERDEWPEALWLIHHQAEQNYTFESPSDFDLSVRTQALVTAVRTALDQFLKKS
jgi:murein peptide amidase A